MTNTNPSLVSIIIPVYNRGNLIGKALTSAINQTYTHWECLVIDDGSIDNTEDVIKSYQARDKRIKYLKRDRLPKGGSTCRNIGIEKSRGDYIIFLDSDDLLANNCLLNRTQFMEANAKLDYAVFPMELFNEEIGDLNTVWNTENNDSHLNRFLKLDSVWPITGPIWKAKTIQQIGGFNEMLKCWQDVDLHLKSLFLNFEYKSFFNSTPDCYCRRHQFESISQSSLNSYEKLKSRQALYFWTIDQLGSQAIKAKPMALNIIISSIKGLKGYYALKFLFKSHQHYSLKELTLLGVLLSIYKVRLYKTRPFSQAVSKIITHILHE